ncbi:mevalonate kinase [Heyndrickxia acidiproducens]|uniref:mevalonate kinase n=1 Tax=Heyndrickxia acidiproducens TaxID=1121084 RepID=UPI00036091F6|nr:mevalonate kinase [Heyndrickxia acidiproducens]
MMKLSQKAAVGTAHSKLILVGEHSVVYGKPAIAVPFTKVKVEAVSVQRPGPLTINCRYYSGILDEVPPKMEGIAACAKATLQALNQPLEDIEIELRSSIPIGRGLGSSAAVAIALVRSLYAFFGQKVPREKLLSLVQIAETYAHGSPSGIDMIAETNEHPIWFEKGKTIRPFPIHLPHYLIVADSGRYGDTFLAVQEIREKKKYEPENVKYAIDRLGEIVYEVKAAIGKKNAGLLGKLLDAAQDQLAALGVSDRGLDHLIETARAAGALGAKLTGGGRGGCIIALAENSRKAEKIACALKKAGAAKTWHFSLGGEM